MFKVKVVDKRAGTIDLTFKFSHDSVWVRHGLRRCTQVRILGDNGRMYRDAMSICHPKDNFSRATGRKVALTKVISSFPRGIRRMVWDAYFRVSKQ